MPENAVRQGLSAFQFVILLRMIPNSYAVEPVFRRKRESNRKYMKKIREKSKKFAEHERIAEETGGGRQARCRAQRKGRGDNAPL